MIEFKDGAVCYAGGKQWFFNGIVEPYKLVCNLRLAFLESLDSALSFDDFQLNEPKSGYYIPKSELDTEEKYNQAVEVLGLSGFKFETCASDLFGVMREHDMLTCCNDGLWQTSDSVRLCKVKLTFDQLMAIGELKRKMNGRENEFIESRQLDVEMIKRVGAGGCGGASKLPNGSKPKSKEAYRVLESMGVEWDNVEGKWFKKEWL